MSHSTHDSSSGGDSILSHIHDISDLDVDSLHISEGSIDPPGYDDTYYLDDGDCIVQVENTLFKVHRWALSRDSSAFYDMFTNATGKDQTHSKEEGSSDAAPISIQGDTVEHFRSLLCILYALPDVILAKSFPKTADDIEFLSKVAEIAHKYHFSHIESWAFHVLCQTPDNDSFWSSHIDSASRLLDISYLCNHEPLRAKLLKVWIPRLLSLVTPATPALLIVDRYQTQSLQAAAYYSHVLQMNKTCSNGRLPLDSPFSQSQYIGLLRGYWWLSHQCNIMAENPPMYEHLETCTSQRSCAEKWKTAWKQLFEETSANQSCDVLTRLKQIQKIDRLSVKGKYRVPVDQCFQEYVDNFLVLFLKEAIL